MTQSIQYIAQDQSEDGNWVVYMFMKSIQGISDDTYQVRVFLYNTVANTSQNIYDEPEYFIISEIGSIPQQYLLMVAG